MPIELNETETRLLIDLLNDSIGTVREEIHHAKAPNFKDELKEQEAVLGALLVKVKSAHGQGKHACCGG